MAKLVVMFDEAVLAEHVLDKNYVKIGRKQTNDVVLDYLSVSGEHAAVALESAQYYVEDLGSTNGTVVNGKSIKKHALKDGDNIDFGRYRLVFRLGDGEVKSTQNQAVKKDGSTRLGGHTVPPDLRVLLARARNANVPDPDTVQEKPAVHGQDGKLTLLNGPNAGKSIALNKSLMTLGKPGVQVAVIAKRSQGYFLAHVEGKSQPTINGIVVDAHGKALKNHDVIELGGIKMEFILP